MIQVDPQYIEEIRCVQEMFFHTKAGGLLLAGIMAQGHFDEPPQNEKERIEYNFAHRILRSAGVELVPRPADLEPNISVEQNAIDTTLGLIEGEPND